MVHVVDGEHPGGVVGQQAHLPAVLRLVQNVDLLKHVYCVVASHLEINMEICPPCKMISTA